MPSSTIVRNLGAILGTCTVQSGKRHVGTHGGEFHTCPAVGPDLRRKPFHCGHRCDNDFWERANPTEVRAQLDLGADLAATDGDLGGAALHVAATVANDPAAIATLLEAGADIEARTYRGMTPLHSAAEFSSAPAAIIDALLANGIYIETINDEGRTACGIAPGTGRYNATPRLSCRQLRASADFPGQ